MSLRIRLWDRADGRGDVAGALNTILTDPPYGEGVDEAKVSFIVPTRLPCSSPVEHDNKCCLDYSQLDEGRGDPWNTEVAGGGAARPVDGVLVQGVWSTYHSTRPVSSVSGRYPFRYPFHSLDSHISLHPVDDAER